MAEGSFPLTNFKSVMLSDRPSGKTDSGPRKSDQPPPFVAMVKPKDAIGLVPSKDIHRKKAKDLNPSLKNKSKSSAVSKHKKWLREMQEMNRAARNEEMDHMVSLESKTQNFTKKQQQMRNALRKRVEAAEAAQKALAEQERQERAEKAAKAQEAAKPPRAKKKSKPKWAMTEVEADDQEEEETEDLVSFAQSLDFEQYMEDYEVRQALELVRQRVQELEDAAIGNDEDGDGYETEDEGDDEDQLASDDDGEVAPKPRRRKKKKKSGIKITTTDSTVDGEKESGWNQKAPNEQVAGVKAAQRLLASSQSIRSIHSAASLQQVLARKKDGKDRPLIPPGTRERQVLAEYQAGAAAKTERAGNGATTSQDVDPNNLPYLHRNPAV